MALSIFKWKMILMMIILTIHITVTWTFHMDQQMKQAKNLEFGIRKNKSVDKEKRKWETPTDVVECELGIIFDIEIDE